MKSSRSLRFKLRRWVLPQLRALPHFIIIGAQKCGTTSLYSYLQRHPLMKRSYRKEVHFFDTPRHYAAGLNWYRANFPTVFEACWTQWTKGAPMITGEASPYYIMCPRSPRLVAETLPDVKLIALLRDPIQRTYSSYHRALRVGQEKLTFEEAIEREPERLAGEYEKMMADPGYQGINYRVYSYATRSIYADQLERWFQYFNPSRLLVISTSDLASDPSGQLRKVTDFLGLPDAGIVIPPEHRRNVAGYPPMNPSTHEKLRAFFAPHNERLYKLLGRDFGWER
jgi:hypothetical protein